ncbi:DUF4167 domain-containing protein [Brevundimonas denitrificans]|uniref:DUF4167 domain-containing protein n=1 Tax=Brevundimonas denitrificans TaxID=1443434 RepID=UPI00352D44ED
MKRQRGRNRKPGGNQGNSANPNRSWDSQGPENIKVRGNAQTVYERYQQLARDASSSSDRVLAENYLQHAEHYFRVLRALQPQRSFQEIAQREQIGQGSTSTSRMNPAPRPRLRRRPAGRRPPGSAAAERPAGPAAAESRAGRRPESG